MLLPVPLTYADLPPSPREARTGKSDGKQMINRNAFAQTRVSQSVNSWTVVGWMGGRYGLGLEDWLIGWRVKVKECLDKHSLVDIHSKELVFDTLRWAREHRNRKCLRWKKEKKKNQTLSRYRVVFNANSTVPAIEQSLRWQSKKKKYARPLKETLWWGGSRPGPRPGTVADGKNQNVPDKFNLSLRHNKMRKEHYIIFFFFSFSEKT